MTIACALKWGEASIGVYSIGHSSPFMGPHIRYKEYIDARHSLEVAVVKKDGLWLCIHFCKDAWSKLVLTCICVKRIIIKFLWDYFKYNFLCFK